MNVFRYLFLVLFLSLGVSTAALADDTKPPASGTGGPPAGGGTETVEQKLAAALRREEELKTELEKHKKPPTPPKEGDDGDDELRKKVAKARETEDEMKRQTKDIERALSFNMGIDSFVKTNADLLPAEVGAIVAQANKETYDTAHAKASALKSSIIQSYFSIQSNLEALTASQKVALADYLKLTKSGKESRAADVYENIFEPALETIRKVKKAEEVGRSRAGFASPSDANQAYKDRLIKNSRKAHLNEKDS